MIRIFIESGTGQASKHGKRTTNEEDFVGEFVHHYFPEKEVGTDFEILGTGGKDAIEKVSFLFKDNTLNGGCNLVIFDADTDKTGGGFEKRRNELLTLRKKLSIDFELFLWPDNKSDGIFEDLLLNIINPEHRCLLECFEGFEQCIRSKDIENKQYNIPNLKSKIYTYISTFKKTEKERKLFKDGHWLFEDKKYWNLDSDFLLPLKDFLHDNL